MASNRLVPPKGLSIDFKPSERQYEMWQLLQPNYCHLCGGEIEQAFVGYNARGQEQYKPRCVKCHNENLASTILSGGAAGGGKSYTGSAWLISSCMRFENIRAFVGRRTLKSLKESTWNTILTIVKQWGLKEDVNYKINNLEGTMTFWNDSVIIMKDLCYMPSDPTYQRFGSSEYTIGFIDEAGECDQGAIEVITSRCRWRIHETFKVAKVLLSTNPCLGYIRSRFVQDDDGNPAVLSEGDYYVPFSVFDNPDVAFRQVYEAALNKIKDQATKQRLLYGNWDFIEANNMVVYSSFNGEKHLKRDLKESVYNPIKPAIISLDFNVAPFMSSLVCQVDYENKKFYVLEEIVGRPENKENNTPALSRKLKGHMSTLKHIGGIDITGDPAGLQRSTATEEGVNNYTIVSDTFGNGILKPRIRLLTKQPPQKPRVEFINRLFDGFDGWEILIDLRCRRLTEDLIYQLKNEDGTKSKKKVTDPKTGVKYEKYGHMSDCLDYALCYYLSKVWNKFKSGNSAGVTTVSSGDGAIVYGNFNY